MATGNCAAQISSRILSQKPKKGKETIMHNDHGDHLAKVLKEGLELVHEIQETDRLMWNGQWAELEEHIRRLIAKYPIEAATYRLLFGRPICNSYQHGEICKHFLRWVFVQKRLSEALHSLFAPTPLSPLPSMPPSARNKQHRTKG